MSGKRVFVWVLAGAVLATMVSGISASLAAEKKPPRTPARQANGIVGIVTAKSDKDITIKAEGEAEAKRYLLAPKDGGAPPAGVQAALKMVFVTNVVIFQRQGEQDPVLTAIQAIHSKTRLGVATGTVVAVEPAANMPSVDVKPSGQGFTERYVPRWDVAAKGWDKNLVGIIAGLSVGDKVKIAWSYDERKRANQIQVIGKAKGKPSPKKSEE